MRQKVPLLALVAIAALVLATVLYVRVGPGERRQQAVELARLRIRQAALQDSLSAIMAREPLLEFAQIQSSDVAVALSESLVTTLIHEMASRYLDRIELALEPDIDESKGGDLKVNTPFGRMKLGEWGVDVAVREIFGVLSAKRPLVSFSGTNRIELAIPAEIREGHGSVTLHFKWNPRAGLGIVCRDFETTQTVDGFVLPQEHVVQGDLVLSAGETSIIAEPRFPREKFPLAMTLTPQSWDRLRQVLQEQDKLMRCGMFMDPDNVIERLRRLGFRGIKIRLPRSLFRTLRLPASITKSVRILKSSVEVSVKPDELRISPGYFWYSASIDARPSRTPDQPIPWPAGGK